MWSLVRKRCDKITLTKLSLHLFKLNYKPNVKALLFLELEFSSGGWRGYVMEFENWKTDVFILMTLPMAFFTRVLTQLTFTHI